STALHPWGASSSAMRPPTVSRSPTSTTSLAAIRKASAKTSSTAAAGGSTTTTAPAAPSPSGTGEGAGDVRATASPKTAATDGLAGAAVLHVGLPQRVAPDHLEPGPDVRVDDLRLAVAVGRHMVVEARADETQVGVALQQTAQSRKPRRLELRDDEVGIRDDERVARRGVDAVLERRNVLV